MKLFLWAAFPLLLYSFQPGKASGDAAPAGLLTLNSDGVKEEEGASSFPAEAQPQKSVQDLSWRSIYTPVKSCHKNLTEKHGEFSPPSFPNGFEGTVWCNWTVWAGSRKHIVIYIKGFLSGERCDVSDDKIFFHGVSSLVEDAVIYACWQKEVHVFATYAKGVNVVLLLRYSAHLRKEKFVGKYYIFKHRETKNSPKGVVDSSEILFPELSRLVLTSLPQSEKEAFLSVWDSVNTSLSASHRTNRVNELSESSSARREVVRVADRPSFVWEVTDTEHVLPQSPSLMSMSSMDNRKFPCSSETLIEMRGHTSWGHLSDSTAPSNVLSYVPYLSSSPLIKPSSPIEGSALLSTSWSAFVMSDPQLGGKKSQQIHISDTYPLALSHSLEATTEVNSEFISTHRVEEVMSTNFQNVMPVPEGVSRDAPVFETAPLLTPEQNWIRTEIQGDSFLLLSKTLEQGQPSRQSGSPERILSGDRYRSKWESRTALVPEESTMMSDTRPILESSMEVIDLLKTNWDITAPCDSPCGRFSPKTRSNSNEAFGTIENTLPVATEFITSADVSLNLATEMLGESHKTNWEGQSSYFGGRRTKPELPFFLDEAAMAPTIPPEPEFFTFNQDRGLSLKIKPTLPFPDIEVEHSLPHGSKAFFLLAIPDREPTPSYVGSVLFPSMVLTHPLSFVEPDRMLDLPELSSFVLSETTQALSLTVERPRAITSGLEFDCSETAAILQTATELENVLSPSVTLLELAVSLTTMLNSLANEQTMSAFYTVDEITSSLGMLTANAVKLMSSSTSCCEHAAKEDLSLLTVQPSGSVDPTVGVPTRSFSAAESEYLFPNPKMAFTKQQLLEGKNDNFITAPEEEDEKALFSVAVKHLDLFSETQPFPSLSGFTENGQFPQNESVTEMTSLAFVPVTGEEKSAMDCTFISHTTVTSVLSQTKMQTQAVFPSPLKSVDDPTGPTKRPQECWERQRSVEWQKTVLEITVADINVPETHVKAVPQKNTEEPQTPQLPSDAENKVVSQVPWNDIEWGFPWLMVYLPVKSCHVTLTGEAGTFSPPPFSSIQANHWCNWTIWAGPDKHILIYIEGFEGKPGCEENQDKILFQGVTSRPENRVTDACRNHGTLVFATQAVAARVVFLSKASPQIDGPKHFKGRYYIFEDYQTSASADGDALPEALESGSRHGIPSYKIHSRRISDFEKTGRIPSDVNIRPVSREGRRNKTNTASSLKALPEPAVSNYPIVSFSKSTASTLDMKEIEVIKPAADEHRTGSLKKTVALGSNGLEGKEKATLSAASSYDSQKFRTKTNLMTAGIITTSAGPGKNGHAPVHQRPTYEKDIGRAKFERSGSPSWVTFPQVFLREQRLPVSPPKSIPEEDTHLVLQPWPSKTEISKKVSNVVEFQQVEIKEAAGGERTSGQVVREGNGDSYVAGRSRSHSTELLSVNVPDKSTMKPRPHLTTSAHPKVFRVVSSLNVLNSDLMGITTTSQSQVVLPDSVFVFRPDENDSILESQHKPGDVLLEVTFGIEHRGWIPQDGSELEEDLIKSVKMQVREKVKFLSNKVKEIKLKEIKRKERSGRKRINDPNLIFTFWLHLVPEEKNISHFIHSQLEGLDGTATGSGRIQQVSVGDVNECSSGIELCGEEAICLNGYGTYFCQCKEEYEDQSENKSGTLCVRVPFSGLRFLYSYMEIFVGVTVFFMALIVVATSVLCALLRKKQTKKDLSVPEMASPNTHVAPPSQSVAFDLDNVGDLLTLDPARLKLRARSPEWSLELGSSPTEACKVFMEQSERL
ncbi:uncharacterized protein LOC132565967 [Heteronotia binoei]|uniref:uncharacterized protein LOC132565967 n=1 Tax=Heteronotia binoei TaxID=13085 RepID=UPI00292F3307|nr:uncharacterized protein LOC132565967 [Heteronotia binoei]